MGHVEDERGEPEVARLPSHKRERPKFLPRVNVRLAEWGKAS
jgi:hypothetical protein